MSRAHKPVSSSNRPGGRRAWQRMLAAVLLSTALVFAFTPPARADVVTSIEDVAALVAHWALDNADWLEDQAQELWDEVNTAILAAVPIATKAVQANINASLSQSKADGDMRREQATAAADTAGRQIFPLGSPFCALTHVWQEISVSQAVTDQLEAKLSTLSSTRGSGVKADSNSPAYIAGEVAELCKLGFIDTSTTGRYGPLPKNMKCTTLAGNDARFIDADLRLSSVIGKLQYPLPQTSHVTPTVDGHISFVGTTTTETESGLGSEMDYAAAYKFCEHLQPDLTAPPHPSGTPKVEDMAAMTAYANDLAVRNAAAEECFRALAYRTSCPAGSVTSLQAPGGSASCHEAQQQVCARLTAAYADGGLALTMQGDNPVYAAALDACKNKDEGLSPAMADAIMAYRCHDRVYSLQTLVSVVGDGPKLEYARNFDCPAEEEIYRNKMDDEKMRLQVAIKNLLIMSTR